MDGPRDCHTKWSKSDKERHTSLLYGILKKNGINELIYKTEIESQMWKTNLWLPRGRGGEGINWEIGINLYMLLYVQ